MIPRITTTTTIETSPKDVMRNLHLAPDTAPKPEAFAALVLTPELILLDLLAPREPRPILPVILTSAIAGWGLTRIFYDGLQTSKLFELQLSSLLERS